MNNDLSLQQKKTLDIYTKTAIDYDELDKEYEINVHIPIRKLLLNDVYGDVIEGGVGTGNNLEYYNNEIMNSLLGFDLTPSMLDIARSKIFKLNNNFPISIILSDATKLKDITSNNYDCYVSTYMFCVFPNENLIKLGIDEMVRVLKNPISIIDENTNEEKIVYKGRFRIVEIIKSKNEKLKEKQIKNINTIGAERYGLNIDHGVLDLLENHPNLTNITTQFIHQDTFILIEGWKK
jgi:ubiquinone/menaquinone biosynthesis C-methylase UbiE